MRTTSILLSFAASTSIVLLAACTSTTVGTGDPATSASVCARYCAAVESEHCENDEEEERCVDTCEAGRDDAPAGCRSTFDDLLDCTTGVSLQCNSEGKATISGSSCNREVEAYVACVVDQPDVEDKDAGRPTPDASPVEEVPKCGSLGFDDENCDACREANCCDEGEACSADDDCFDYITCLRTNDCSDDSCIEMCQAAHPTGWSAGDAFLECLGTTCAAACN